MSDAPGTIRRIEDPEAEVARLGRARSRRKVVLGEMIAATRKAPDGDDEILWLSVWSDAAEPWALSPDFLPRLGTAAREILEAAGE